MQSKDFILAYQTLEKRLFGFAFRLTKSHVDAEDLMQETVIRAYTNRDKFREGTNFKAWISTIMRNTFTNRYHRKKRRGIVDGPVELYPYATERLIVLNDSESEIMIEELSTILEQLDSKYRIPFLMSYQGFEYQEISESLEIPVGTVKSRLYTARQRLKVMVQNYYGEQVVA